MTKKLLDNVADEEMVLKKTVSAKEFRDRELDDLRYLLGHKQFRRFVWRLLTHCSVYDSVFNENSKRMARATGKQDVGHFVMSEVVQADDDAYFKMMLEAKEETL